MTKYALEEKRFMKKVNRMFAVGTAIMILMIAILAFIGFIHSISVGNDNWVVMAPIWFVIILAVFIKGQ
jgi:uncharacterized membrane protein YkvI